MCYDVVRAKVKWLIPTVMFPLSSWRFNAQAMLFFVIGDEDFVDDIIADCSFCRPTLS